ncbi:Autotransporter domain-containing protein [Gammaproteobacteria bacterium]
MKLINIVKLPIAIILIASGTNTFASAAQSCASLLTFYNSSGCDQQCRNDYAARFPDCFSDNLNASSVSINSTSFAQVVTVSNAISSQFFFSDRPRHNMDIKGKGMAGGGENARWNVWGNLTNNDTRHDRNTVDFESTVLTTVIGADYALSPNMMVGISGAFDNGNGSLGLNSDFTSKGLSIAPYFGMQFSPELALDASIGMGSGELNTNGIENKSDRWFGGTNLSYNHWMNNIQLTGKLSYLHGEEAYHDAARNKLDQIRLGVQTGYWMESMMPYVGLSYSSDISRSTNLANAPTDYIGKEAWIWTVGLNFFSLRNGLTGSIAYSQEEGRTYQKNNVLVANIGLRF